MNAMSKLVAAALAAGGLAIAGPAAAQHHGGGHGGGHWSGGHGSGGHWGGGHFDHGRHFHRGFGAWSFAFGVPLFWPGYAWGYPYSYPAYSYPYAYGYAYPAYPAYPQGGWAPSAEEDLGPAPDVAPGPGAPTEGPLYMNYCASAKAYYPKVTQCPEGWKFIAPTR